MERLEVCQVNALLVQQFDSIGDYDAAVCVCLVLFLCRQIRLLDSFVTSQLNFIFHSEIVHQVRVVFRSDDRSIALVFLRMQACKS